MKNYFFVCVSVFLMGFLQIFGQSVVPHIPMSFNIDYSRYRSSLNEGCLDLYFSIYPSSVTLEKNRDSLKGSVVFHVVIVNIQNDSLVVRSSVSLPILLGDTTKASLATSFIGKTTYRLPLGSYGIRIHAFDAKNPERQDSMYRRFSIESYDRTSMMSDVELCSRIVQTQEKSNPFYKNSYEVLTNPSLVFGTAAKPVVFTYAEFYNLRIDTPYSIVTQIVDARNTVLKQQKRVRQFHAKNVVDVATLNISSLPSGKYKFQLILCDTIGNIYSQSEKPLFIYNPDIQQSVVPVIMAKNVEFAGLSNEELIQEFEKARYLVSSEDTRTFERLTTAEGRREFLSNLWANIESGKRGSIEITRALYQQRIMVANQRYRFMGREGWLSDRGRIYLLYAEPDEIQRFPNSEDCRPYEIWNYNQIENGVIFVFVDYTGLGEYRLVHSTKRGELQDGSWERFLH